MNQKTQNRPKIPESSTDDDDEEEKPTDEQLEAKKVKALVSKLERKVCKGYF